MICGDPLRFAIESEITSQSGLMVYGRFRIWAQGVSIGLYSEEVVDLKSTTGRLRESVAFASEEIAALTATEFLDRVWSTVYGTSGEFKMDEFTKWRPFVWIDSSEGFEDVRSVASCKNGLCRIVWLNEETGFAARELILPLVQYQTTVDSFLAWLDTELQSRRTNAGRFSPNNPMNPSGGSGVNSNQ